MLLHATEDQGQSGLRLKPDSKEGCSHVRNLDMDVESANGMLLNHIKANRKAIHKFLTVLKQRQQGMGFTWAGILWKKY